MNADLHEGMSDGMYKKVAMNRGGIVEQTTHDMREPLRDVWYGVHECQPKMLPDGTRQATPNYVARKDAEPDL
jgi:hypothetical protein